MLPSSAATKAVAGSRPVTVFAALGPNPASLAELVWGLHRKRGLVVTDLFLVVDQRGHDYLHKELIGDGNVLAELQHLLGIAISGDNIRERVVHPLAGGALDDEDPADADLYSAAIWESAREATVQAGQRPVVFGLTAGRRRTMTAMSTMAFQLLARRQDFCIDVRVTDKRAEGGSGFYFPEQLQQEIVPKVGEVFLARDVDVQLVNVQLPRLRGLLSDAALATYASALAAGQAAVDAVAVPRLVVDFKIGESRVDDVPLPLTPAELVWYGALALARRDGEGWISATDLGALKASANACAKFAWSDAAKAKPIKALLGAPELYDDEAELLGDLAKLKSDTKKGMKAWCIKHRPSCTTMLTPQDKRWKVDGVLAFHQRLPLASERVEIIGLPPSQSYVGPRSSRSLVCWLQQQTRRTR